MAGVTHPPLYHVILRWWMDFFGNGPTAIRALSAICSLAAVGVFYDLCRLLHGGRIALLAAAIMALAPAQIDFAQEARSYPQMILLCLACADLLVRIDKFGDAPRRWVALSVCFVAAALTHYFALGALAALAIYAAVRKNRGAIKPFLVGAVVSIVLWGWPFWRQIHSLPSARPGYLYPNDPDHFHMTLLHLVGMCGQWLVGPRFAALVPPGLLALIAGVALIWPMVRLPVRRDTSLWLIWIAATAGPLAASDLLRSSSFLGFLRYTILASPAVYALLASIDFPPRAVIRDAVGWCALVLVGLFAAARVIQGPQSKEDWRELMTTLDQKASTGDLLVFYGDDPWLSPGTWYMGYMYYVPDSQRPWLILRQPADAELLKSLQARGTLWLIGRYPDQGENPLPGWEIDDGVKTSAGAAWRMIPPHP
jgi:4-amino-4-deoxy-L-arabinose transferase-like glycosyltransferase